jgi:uncharacterized Zn-binding protein involved in type VI secretion
MGRSFILFGDKTDHGGTVITASGIAQSGGRKIACVGDKVRCPKHDDITTIVTGDASMLIDGKPVARHGDKTSCGASLIATQTASSVG